MNTVSKFRESFSCYGVPKLIVTDNGTQFTTEIFQEFCKRNGIKHVHSTLYHPINNGKVESRYLASISDRKEMMQNPAKPTETSL